MPGPNPTIMSLNARLAALESLVHNLEDVMQEQGIPGLDAINLVGGGGGGGMGGQLNNSGEVSEESGYHVEPNGEVIYQVGSVNLPCGKLLCESGNLIWENLAKEKILLLNAKGESALLPQGNYYMLGRVSGATTLKVGEELNMGLTEEEVVTPGKKRHEKVLAGVNLLVNGLESISGVKNLAGQFRSKFFLTIAGVNGGAANTYTAEVKVIVGGVVVNKITFAGNSNNANVVSIAAAGYVQAGQAVELKVKCVAVGGAQTGVTFYNNEFLANEDCYLRMTVE